jgi:CheY-like chemotaxis protein
MTTQPPQLPQAIPAKEPVRLGQVDIAGNANLPQAIPVNAGQRKAKNLLPVRRASRIGESKDAKGTGLVGSDRIEPTEEKKGKAETADSPQPVLPSCPPPADPVLPETPAMAPAKTDVPSKEDRLFEGAAALEELREQRAKPDNPVADPVGIRPVESQAVLPETPTSTPAITGVQPGDVTPCATPTVGLKKPRNRVSRAVALERRIQKLEAIMRRARKRSSAKKPGVKSTNLLRGPLPEPPPGDAAGQVAPAVNAMRDSGPAESGSHATPQDGEPAAPVVSSEQPLAGDVPWQLTPFADQAGEPVDQAVETPILPDSTPHQNQITYEQFIETEPHDELPEDAKESELNANESSSMDAVVEEPTILDAPPATAVDGGTPVEIERRRLPDDEAEPVVNPLREEVSTDEAAGRLGIASSAQGGESADGVRRSRKKVLVVDDDATMRMLLKMGLGSQDYDCLTAENGRVAQEMLQTHRPDLILVDLLMPVMDGLTFLRWLRQSARDATPVLVFTNVNTPRITQEALACGANAFACKPLHLRELLEVINQLVPA